MDYYSTPNNTMMKSKDVYKFFYLKKCSEPQCCSLCYGFKSFWVSLYKLCTLGFVWFIPAQSDWIGGVWTTIFRSLCRCIMRFKSGLWLGHLRTVRDFSWSLSNIVLDSFGSLSCWNHCPSVKHTAVKDVFFRTSVYLATVLLPPILMTLPMTSTSVAWCCYHPTAA